MGNVVTGKSPSILARAAVAAGTVVAALILSLSLRAYIGNVLFIFFFGALAVVAWYSGFWGALFVVVAAVLSVDYFFMRPVGSLALDSSGMVTIAIFLGVASLISWIANRMRVAERLANERAQLLEEQAVELETALTEATETRDMAEIANRAKGEFLAVMSHELRTPLNAIVGYTDLLQSEVAGALTPAQKTQLERIRASSWHLLDLIQDVLSFARVEAGRETLRYGDIDAVNLVQDVVQYVAKTANDKKIEISTDLPDQPVVMITDPSKLRQILLNLLTNAVKFTERGTVELKLSSDGGDIVQFAVSDTGRGIAASDHDRIFEPFTQVDQTTTRDNGGVGLGLPVSRRLAHLLGGTLTLKSQFGDGSTFVLRLPVNSTR